MILRRCRYCELAARVNRTPWHKRATYRRSPRFLPASVTGTQWLGLAKADERRPRRPRRCKSRKRKESMDETRNEEVGRLTVQAALTSRAVVSKGELAWHPLLISPHSTPSGSPLSSLSYIHPQPLPPATFRLLFTLSSFSCYSHPRPTPPFFIPYVSPSACFRFFHFSFGDGNTGR